MSERPTPDLAIVETRVYRGANVWSYEQVDPPRGRPRLARAVPDATRSPASPTTWSRCCRACASTPARAGAAAASSSGSTRAPGSATSPSTPRWRCSRSVGHDIRRGKTRQVKGQPGPLQHHLRLRRRAGRPRRRRGSPYAWSTTSSRPTRSFDWEAERDGVHPARRAHRVRSLDPGDRRRGRLPRHPVDPAQPALPGPARPGRPRQADPRHDDLGDVARSRSTSPPTRTSPPGCSAPPGCRCPSRSRCAPRTRPSPPPSGSATPSCVKPLDGNHGRGVCLDLQDEDDVREAFPIAQEQSRRGNVIVESFVTGKDYRCLIIDGRMVAIAERVPGVA